MHEEPRSKAAEWPTRLFTFRDALMEAMSKHAVEHRGDAFSDRAVDLEMVRKAFYRRYVVCGDETREQKQDSRQKAFLRQSGEARAKELIRGEVMADGTQLVWPAVV